MIDSCLIEMGVVSSHFVWLLRTRGIRRRAKEAGQTFDESPEGIEWQSRGIDVKRKLKALFSKKEPSSPEEESRSEAGSVETLISPENVIPKTVPNALV